MENRNEPRRPMHLAAIAGLLLALILIFYWKILFTNRAMFPWDAADYFYPAFAFAHEEFRHFRLPLWDPYVLSGYPIIGDIQAQIFYPVNWLFVLLHPLAPLPYRLVEMQEILHFLLAGLFMYLLAREFVESRWAALLGGILYMFSGAMVARTQHVNAVDAMAWSPLIFLTARRALLRRDWFYAATAGMLYGIQWLAGRWQHSVYLGLFLFLYFLYEAALGPERGRLWPRWIVMLAIIAGIGGALAMVQIVPAYQLGYESVRTFINYWEVSVGNDPRFLWTLFLPNYLGGINGIPPRFPYDLTFNYVFITVPGTLLAIAGLATTLRRRNFFWLAALVLFITLALGNQGPLAGLVYHIPILNLFRTMAAFFEIANLILCLLAAIGAERLLAAEQPPRTRRFIAGGLVAALLVGVGSVVAPITTEVPSLKHAVLMLAITTAVVLARLAGRIPPRVALAAVVVLATFELWFYNSSQAFNASPENPSTFLSADYAVGSKESVAFLRADPATDFRVAALAEYQWTGNGWNLWRIPGITGVNPVALRRYDEYMTVFSHILNVRIPTGGEDHDVRSPLADLLGAKYLVLADPAKEATFGLGKGGGGGKYQRVFEDQQWWRIYRNSEYIAHAWFYPKAYVAPNQTKVFDLLSSPWFDPRRTLLLEADDFPQGAKQHTENLSTIDLFPSSSAAMTGGEPMSDPYCAQPVPMIGGWGGQGGQNGDLRFTLPATLSPGHYRLLVRYTANELKLYSLGLEQLSQKYPWYRTALGEMPRLQATLENAGAPSSLAPVSLPRTFVWPCHEARTVDLGELQVERGARAIGIASLMDSALNIYSVSLVQMPKESPPNARFEFRDFAISATRFAFTAEVGEDGFALVNEVYDPAWDAMVDGRSARIYPADGTFRALYLTAGTHRIEFAFHPRHFYLGAGISLLTGLGCLSYLGFSRKERRRTGKASPATEPNPQ